MSQPAANPSKRNAIDEPDVIPEIDDDDERLRHIDMNCDQVRRRIRTFLENGEMKVTEFQKQIGSRSESLNNFLGQNGPLKGSGSDVYVRTFKFFKKRELQGLKQPKKKVEKEDEQKKIDVSGIHLEGENEAEVEVYETCDEIRKKIKAFLRDPNVTQAGFCREISKTFQNGKKVTAKNLTDFLGKKGPSAGNITTAFYAAYVTLRNCASRRASRRASSDKRWRRFGMARVLSMVRRASIPRLRAIVDTCVGQMSSLMRISMAGLPSISSTRSGQDAFCFRRSASLGLLLRGSTTEAT